jgi:hypothetical protein
MWVRAWISSILRVARHPALWGIALRTWLRMSPARWWQRPPFFPFPDRAYIRFRLDTAYGPGVAPQPDDLVAYLRWCREQEIVRRATKSA